MQFACDLTQTNMYTSLQPRFESGGKSSEESHASFLVTWVLAVEHTADRGPDMVWQVWWSEKKWERTNEGMVPHWLWTIGLVNLSNWKLWDLSNKRNQITFKPSQLRILMVAYTENRQSPETRTENEHITFSERDVNWPEEPNLNLEIQKMSLWCHRR